MDLHGAIRKHKKQHKSSGAHKGGDGKVPSTDGRVEGKVAVSTASSTATSRSHLTTTAFSSLKISAASKRAFTEVLRYNEMTLVQQQALPPALEGYDVIAKARTGTGKTIAFLLPTVERLASSSRGDARQIPALIISPTRELASQIRNECEQLITFHKPRLSSKLVVGGTKVEADVKAIFAQPPLILVATPGRLNDLLYNFGLTKLCGALQTLVFDEADQLLEMGFRPDVTKILSALEATRQSRQTLLFSATLPKDVLKVAEFATRGEAQTHLVDTVGEVVEQTNVTVVTDVTVTGVTNITGEVVEQTNAQVEQCVIVSPLESQAAELLALLRQLTQARPHKIVVRYIRYSYIHRRGRTRSSSVTSVKLHPLHPLQTRPHKVVVRYIRYSYIRSSYIRYIRYRRGRTRSSSFSSRHD